MRGPRKGCARELDIPDAHDSLLCVAASLSTIGNKAWKRMEYTDTRQGHSML